MLGLGQKVPAKYPFGPHGVRFMGSKKHVHLCTYMRVHPYTRPPMGPKKGQKRVLGITLARQNVFTQYVYSFPRFFGVPDRSRTVSGPNGTIWTPVQGGGGVGGGPPRRTPKNPQIGKKKFTKIAIKWARRGVTICVKHIN